MRYENPAPLNLKLKQVERAKNVLFTSFSQGIMNEKPCKGSEQMRGTEEKEKWRSDFSACLNLS